MATGRASAREGGGSSSREPVDRPVPLVEMPRGGGASVPERSPLRAFPCDVLHAAGMRKETHMKLSKGVAAVLSATASAAFCADPPVTYGPPVVVTATRFEQSRDAFPIGTTVIDREAIERSTATT